MQRLTSPRLVPSSSEGGNLQQANLSQLTMTAPGSTPVTPLPPPQQGSNVPEPQQGPLIPVNSGRDRYRTGAPAGGASWQAFGDNDVPDQGQGGWRQL